MEYDPAAPIDAEQWLALDEGERLYAIQCWLAELTGSEIEDCVLEAVPMLAVENQIAMGDPPVTRATLERLLQGGIDRVAAIQVMSDVMADSLAATVTQDRPYDSHAYARAMKQIDPAEIPFDDPNHETTGKPAGGLAAFNTRHRQALIEFADRHADEGAMSWPETVGFLFAVQSCPDIVMPSEWMEVVQGEVVFSDFDEAKAVSEARMALMNWISDRIHQGQPAIPADCAPDPEPMRILEADNNFSRWCAGITDGHDWLAQSWDEVLKIDGDDDRLQSMTLILFAFFTGRAMAERVVEQFAQNAAGSAPSLEELAKSFHDNIQQAVLDYAAIGQLYRQTPSAPPPPQPVRSTKIGRNHPCPCGSGRKYKKCCGRPGAAPEERD